MYMVSTLVAVLAALGGALGWPRRPAVLVAGAVAAALVSIVDTVAYRGPADNAVAVWLLVETLFMLAVLAQVIRRPPVRSAVAAGALVFAAITVSPLRIGLWLTPPAPAYEVVAVCGALALLAAIGIGVGNYLRWMDRERERSIATARREQRIQLARDLHDWLSHEMTGIVLEAQAGQLDGRDPAAIQAFKHIEDAGVRGLDAMERALRLLRDAGDHDSAAETLPTLTEVSEVAQRFSTRAAVRVEVEIGEDLEALRPETVATAHRIVLESLTNVRRHAASVGLVRVQVIRDGPGLVVSVTDDGQGTRLARRGGSGLAGLTERVEALGGTFDAGPATPVGWVVRAILPVSS